tara:strand:- start:1501 stop:2229 length:729 start_codon:yes stop_codon:yes gene_type:complete
MDISLAYLPDANIEGCERLITDLKASGLEIELILLRSLRLNELNLPEATQDAANVDLTTHGGNTLPSENVRMIHWDDETGSRYLAHYYAAVYGRAPIILVIAAGARPDLNTVTGMLRAMENGFDIVIGSRHHKHSEINYPFTRWFLSKAYNWISSLLFRTKTTDATSGLKLFTRTGLIDALRDCSTTEITFQLELLRSARGHGAQITEVPIVIDYSDAPYALKGSDLAKTAFDTIRLWWKVR